MVKNPEKELCLALIPASSTLLPDASERSEDGPRPPRFLFQLSEYRVLVDVGCSLSVT